MAYLLDGIGYKIIGEGKPVFFIHGGPGLTSRYLEYFANEFSKYGYMCFLVDQRGNGQSKKFVTDDITFDAIINDFEKIRRRHHLDKVDIIGHSFGGYITLKYLQDHKHYIGKATIICSIPVTNEHRKMYMKRREKLLNEDDHIYEDIVPEDTPPMLAKLMGLGYPQKELYKERIKDIWCDDMDYDKLLSIMNKLYSIFINDVLPVRLGEISNPVLVIHGEKDFIPVVSSKYISENIPASRLEIIANAGHFPMDEDKKGISDMIDNFFKE